MHCNEAAFAETQKDRDGCQRLREGREVEDGIDRHRDRVRKQAARSVRAMQQDVVTAADEHHDAGDLAARDSLVGGFVDSGKIERAGNVAGRREGGRGKREERNQHHDGDASDNHLRILALWARDYDTQLVFWYFAASRPESTR